MAAKPPRRYRDKTNTNEIKAGLESDDDDDDDISERHFCASELSRNGGGEDRPNPRPYGDASNECEFRVRKSSNLAQSYAINSSRSRYCFRAATVNRAIEMKLSMRADDEVRRSGRE